MGAESRALFLSPESPYPLAGGGPLRSASLFEYLARKYTVDAILFRQPHEPPPACPRASRLGVIKLPVHSRDLASRLGRNAGRLLRGVPPLVDRFSGFEGEIAKLAGGERYALGVVEHFWCAAYHPQIAAFCAKTVLDLHNLESEWHERCAGRERWPISAALRRFGRKALEMERALLARYSLVLAASGQDAARVREIAPQATVFVYPNTIPWVGEPPHAEENVVVFSGNMEYLPNVQAVRHFREAIWPILRRRHEGLRWRLIGKNPQGVARFVRDDPRIELRGPVEDAVSAIAPAKVGVVPVVSGSGTRLKILEMWAAGIPVVSTALGAEGLGAAPGSHLLVADRGNDFADCVSELLSSEQRRRELGAAGRSLYEERFTWEAGWRALDHFGVLLP